MLSRSTPSFEKEFIASPQSLYDCFLAVPFLRIHHWQRPFEWPEQLAKQLVTSIIDSSLRNEDQYFVGSLFFARDPGPPQCFQVVDGAQRLTTLWLTIASVYRILSQALEQVKSSSHRSDIFDSRDRLWNMIVTKSHQCRVAWLRSGKDEEDMRDVLSYVNSDSDLSAKSLKERAEIGKRRLLSAFVHLHDELLGSFGHSISAVQKFANFMAERVFALCVTVDEPQRAMSIFSVLNSPSMRLSDADLLRAELLQRVWRFLYFIKYIFL